MNDLINELEMTDVLQNAVTDCNIEGDLAMTPSPLPNPLPVTFPFPPPITQQNHIIHPNDYYAGTKTVYVPPHLRPPPSHQIPMVPNHPPPVLPPPALTFNATYLPDNSVQLVPQPMSSLIQTPQHEALPEEQERQFSPISESSDDCPRTPGNIKKRKLSMNSLF